MNWNSIKNPPGKGFEQIKVLLDNYHWAIPQMGMYSGMHQKWLFYNAEDDRFYDIDLHPRLMPTHYVIIERCEKLEGDV